MLGVLFTLPSATTTLADVGAYSGPFFTEWLSIAMMIVGILVGGMAIAKVISVVISGSKRVLGGNRSRRGRRR